MRLIKGVLLSAVPGLVSAIPTISSVSPVQGPDAAGGTRVTVGYTLVSALGPCTVELLVSTDGGATFVTANGATGDVGAGVAPGAGHTIQWPVADQFPSQAIPGAVLRIVAEDSAAGIAVTNSGFETDAQPNATLNLIPPTGWTAYGSINGTTRVLGTLNPNTSGHYLDRPPGVANVALVFLNDGPVTEAGLAQTLGAILQADARYRLGCLVGNINEGTANFGYFDLTGFPGYRVDLLAGGVTIASDGNSLSGLIPEGEFLPTTVTAHVGGAHPQLGQALGVRLVNLDLPGTVADPGIEVNFDEVTLHVGGTGSAPPVLVETVPPTSGSASPPPNAAGPTIGVPYSAAADGHSGLSHVELWYRFESGAWANSGFVGAAGAGSFTFTPPGSSPANFGTYHFDLVAEDVAGNRTPEPTGTSGTGDGSTVYGPGAGVRDWRDFGGNGRTR